MRRLAVAAAFIAASTLLACGGDAPVEPGSRGLYAVYNLVSVNGENLPVLVSQNGDERFDLFAEELIFVSTYRVTRSVSVERTSGDQVTVLATTEIGAYELNGANVTFAFLTEPRSGSGTVESDGAISVVFGEDTLVFRSPSGVQ